jgi:predicted amidohydrolase
MNGISIRFLQEVASKFNADVVASLQLQEDKAVVNRLVWVTPEGIKGQYDKRHLFSGTNSKSAFRDKQRIVIERFGWKILPLILLRYPLSCLVQKCLYQ